MEHSSRWPVPARLWEGKSLWSKGAATGPLWGPPEPRGQGGHRSVFAGSPKPWPQCPPPLFTASSKETRRGARSVQAGRAARVPGLQPPLSVGLLGSSRVRRFLLGVETLPTGARGSAGGQGPWRTAHLLCLQNRRKSPRVEVEGAGARLGLPGRVPASCVGPWGHPPSSNPGSPVISVGPQRAHPNPYAAVNLVRHGGRWAALSSNCRQAKRDCLQVPVLAWGPRSVLQQLPELALGQRNPIPTSRNRQGCREYKGGLQAWI